MPEHDPWGEYLDAYADHLARVSASLEEGRVLETPFDRPRPSSAMPARHAERARALVEATEQLATRLERRRDVVGTVLRYSRVRDPERVVLLDVIL